MNISTSFVRITFTFLSVILFIAYTTTSLEGGLNAFNVTTGTVAGLVVALALISTDILTKKFSMRALNIAAIGLFAGYLLGTSINSILSATIDADILALNKSSFTLVKSIIYLVSCYMGLVMVDRATEEFYLSIPFIKFHPVANKKRDILIDSSVLLDSRILDLASSGILDNSLVLPRFFVKELYTQAETGDETTKAKVKRSLDICKKLEALPNLHLRYSETDFSEVKEGAAKLVRLARLSESNIITADISRIQQSSTDGISIINIHTLSNALKPLTQSGEQLQIKIQRYGKDARQGVGYLEDGTMVVVNGGADHIGETIKAQVLSVKHTASGRMIFCNSMDEHHLSYSETAQNFSLDANQHAYFALDSKP